MSVPDNRWVLFLFLLDNEWKRESEMSAQQQSVFHTHTGKEQDSSRFVCMFARPPIVMIHAGTFSPGLDVTELGKDTRPQGPPV